MDRPCPANPLSGLGAHAAGGHIRLHVVCGKIVIPCRIEELRANNALSDRIEKHNGQIYRGKRNSAVYG